MNLMKEMDRTKNLIQKHMMQLCEIIGERPTGSEANKSAAAYAEAAFEQLGLTVRRQEFPCMDWHNE